MRIETKTARGIDTVDLDTRLFTNRDVFLTGTISSENAINFIKQILYLVKEDQNKKIRIFVNSNGGEINAGMLIYDAISGLKNANIDIICMGHAYSMAAVLLAAGKKGHRFGLPSCEIMIHEPLISEISGSSSTIKSMSDSLLDKKKKICEVLSLHTGKTVEEIDHAIAYDHYFDVKEAVEFGLIDEVIGFEKLL